MPWESKKQQRWGHGKGGKKAGFSEEKIKEYDSKTDFESLPEEAACGIAMSDCTDAACAEYATCQKKATASLAACGLAMSECTDACAEYATCKHKPTASAAACGLALSDCTESACAEYATCQKKATASVGACGVAMSECTNALCGQTATCQQAMAFVLSWGPTLVEKLNWAVATAPCGMAMSDCTEAACAEYATCQKKATGFITLKQLEDAAKRGKLLSWGDAEARPCTEGDDDSEYGPRGDDQKCTDEGGGDYGDYGGEGGYEDEPASDVPEGYQEVDMGDPSLDPEGGDWEEFLTEPEEEAPLKETMKEEEKAGEREAKEKAGQEKEHQRTATRIDRDQSLRPEDYHQFWNKDEWHINQAREILEQRAANPKSPEDAEAVRSLLMNGPQVGGGYEKAGKREPGEPGAEDFYQREDKSPIV